MNLQAGLDSKINAGRTQYSTGKRPRWTNPAAAVSKVVSSTSIKTGPEHHRSQTQVIKSDRRTMSKDSTAAATHDDAQGSDKSEQQCLDGVQTVGDAVVMQNQVHVYQVRSKRRRRKNARYAENGDFIVSYDGTSIEKWQPAEADTPHLPASQPLSSEYKPGSQEEGDADLSSQDEGAGSGSH